MEGERKCLMKIVVMTQAASESGALLEAIDDGKKSFLLVFTSIMTAFSWISSESEQELEVSSTIIDCSKMSSRPSSIAILFVDVVGRSTLHHRANKLRAWDITMPRH
jgi:hypothetical protein